MPLPNTATRLTQTPELSIVDLAARGLAPLHVFGRYRSLRAHEPPPVHRHGSLLVLALPVFGEFTFEIDGTEQPVRRGEVIRIPPGSAHRSGTVIEPRGELVWLDVQVDSPASAPDLSRAIALLATRSGALTWPIPNGTLDTVQRAFRTAAGGRDWLADALLSHTLATVVLGMTQTFAGDGTPVPNHRHPSMAKVLAWIEDHLTQPVNAAELAAITGLSTSQFYQAFRAATGTSPKDYLLRRKTAYARDWLLRDPDVTVTAVAHALGFASSQHFATVFRRYHNRAPSECRDGRPG